MAGQWLRLALMAADLGEIGLGRDAIDLFVDNFGSDSAALFKKVDVLASFGALDESLALLRTLSPNVPDAFSHALSRGSLAIGNGATDEARQGLEEALRLRPHPGQAWHLPAVLIDFANEPALAERLFANARPMQDAPPAERAYYYYAPGKAR